MNQHPVLDAALSPAVIDQLTASFGATRAQTQRAATELYDALAQRIQRNTLSRAGVADIVALLGDATAGRATSEAAELASPDVIASGDRVLDVLVGDKHLSRGIAAKAARRSGLDEATTKSMLPAVASLLIGALQRQASPAIAAQLGAFPEIGDLLPMPGGAGTRPPSSGPGDYSDSTPSTNPPRGAGPGGRVILPMPSEPSPRAPQRTPYDDLSDVVRKGGSKAPGGGSLSNLIRSILAGLLGFKNRGVIGSLIYMFLARFGMNLLRRILSRVFGGR